MPPAARATSLFFAARPQSRSFTPSELYSARPLEPRRSPAALLGRHIQPRKLGLAGELGGHGEFGGMPDPRPELTAQELFYAATALRAEARWSSERGNDPQYGSTQEVFREAARGTDALAEKIQRIGEQVARHSAS